MTQDETTGNETPEPQQPATPRPASPQPEPAPAAGSDDQSQDQPVVAALAYVFGIIVPLVILLTDMKKSRYMRFHAFQSLFLCVALIALSMALGILSAVFGHIPSLGIIAGLFMLLLSMILPLAILVLVVVLAVKAYNKQELELPVITQMARDQADKMRV